MVQSKQPFGPQPTRGQRLAEAGGASAVALWAAVITAVVSAIDYYKNFMRGQGADVRLKS